MRFLTIIIFILYLIPNYGQEANKAGTTAAQFLKIGVGAASLGMAGTSAGLVNDASSMYWNPAGLIGVNSISVIASYTDWFVDLKHQYFGIVLPINEDHKIGVGAMILTMGEMEITTEKQPKGTGDFFDKGDGMIYDPIHSIKIGIDANHQNDGPENASIGIEYKWQNLIALRSGYYFNDDVRKLAVGFGLNWDVPQSFAVGVDYAFAELDRLGSVHSISL